MHDKHQIIEEPHEAKISRPVLKTNGVGDNLVEFNFLQPGQIVSLEYGDRNLYAEVIQFVVSRQLCWVRPLLMVTFIEESPLITDLRDASDLLWPANSFCPALDTEVITFLSQLLAKEPKTEADSVAKQQLNQFIHQLWQAYQEGLRIGD